MPAKKVITETELGIGVRQAEDRKRRFVKWHYYS